jgi:hypothetical protein
MEDLRATAELELYDCLESELGTPIILISPDGKRYTNSVNNPTEPLRGQVKMYSKGENPETGEPIIVDEPSVTLRTSSLARVPVANENWFIQFKTSPRLNAPLKSFTFSIDKAYEKGTDLGIIKVRPHECDAVTIPTGSES